MSSGWWLVLGILVGSALWWVIDWRVWRPQRAPRREVEALQKANHQLKADLSATQEALKQQQADYGLMRSALLKAKEDNATLTANLEQVRGQNGRQKKEIHGLQASIETLYMEHVQLTEARDKALAELVQAQRPTKTPPA